MAFRKQDRSQVAGGQPLTAFAAQGIRQNLDAALDGRGRRVSLDFGGVRLASSRVMFAPLYRHPLSEGCTQLTAQALVTVADANVALGVTALTPTGLLHQVPTEVLNTSNALATLTLDTSSLPPGPVLLGLLLQSEIDRTSGKTDGYLAGSSPATDGDRWTFAAPVGLTNTERYVLEIQAVGATGDRYPEPFEVIWWDQDDAASVDEVRIWPPITRPSTSWNSEPYDVTLWNLGVLRLWSVSVQETAWASRGAVALRAGDPPAARAFQELHARAYQAHLRTAIRAAGVRPDPTDTETLTAAAGQRVHVGAVALPHDRYSYLTITYASGTTYRVTIHGVDTDVAATVDEATTLAAIASAINSAVSAVRSNCQATVSDGAVVLRPLIEPPRGDSMSGANAPTASIVSGTGTITLTVGQERGVAAAWVGNYQDDKASVDGDTATPRGKLRLAGCAIITSNERSAQTCRFALYAGLTTFDADEWDADEVYTNVAETDEEVLAGWAGVTLCEDAPTALYDCWRLLDFAYVAREPYRKALRWHTLRGLLPADAVQDLQRDGYLVQWDGAITETETGETHRLLKLTQIGSQESDEGARATLQSRRHVHHFGLCVWAEEVVR